MNANPQFGSTCSEVILLQFLLPSLPDEYTITITTLDVQLNLSVQDKLVALQNREDILRVTKVIEDKALAAKQSTALKKSRDSTKCKFCQCGPHDTDDYEFRKTFNEIIEAFACKQIRQSHKSDRRVHSQKRDQYPKGSTQSSHKRPDRPYRHNHTNHKTKKPQSERREHGHVANEGHSTDESPDDYSTTDSSDNNKLVEHVHLTRDEIRKIPHSY